MAAALIRRVQEAQSMDDISRAIAPPKTGLTLVQRAATMEVALHNLGSAFFHGLSCQLYCANLLRGYCMALPRRHEKTGYILDLEKAINLHEDAGYIDTGSPSIRLIDAQNGSRLLIGRDTSRARSLLTAVNLLPWVSPCTLKQAESLYHISPSSSFNTSDYLLPLKFEVMISLSAYLRFAQFCFRL